MPAAARRVEPNRLRARVPLVGRADELAALDGVLDELPAGAGCGVFVLGDAGIGKTRVADEAVRRAGERGVRTLRGRASAIGVAVPFRPLTEALLNLVRAGGPGPAELGPYGPVLGRLIPDWREPGQQPQADSLVVLAEAVLRLLRLIGGEHGSLLVLEDLHCADPETLAVVEYLLDNIQAQPTALLCTLRGEDSAALGLLDNAARLDHLLRMDLAGLDADEVRALLAGALRAEPEEVPAGFAERIRRDSGGNPFEAGELLRDALERGALTRQAHGWAEAGEPEQSTSGRGLPGRLERLGERGRTVLRTAALLGDRFSAELLGRVTGLAGPELRDALAESAQLVLPDEDDAGWYSFANPLAAQTLRAHLSPAEESELSAHAAEVIERDEPELPGELCQLVAHLRSRAGQSDVAGALFLRAGQRAAGQGAYASAVTLFDRAHDLLDAAGPEASVEILEPQITALGELGEFERVHKIADALDELAIAGLSGPGQARLHVALAGAAMLEGRVSDGLARAERARTLLGPAATDEQLAPIDAVAAHLTLAAPVPDRLTVAERLARRALAAAVRVPLPAVVCNAEYVLGMLCGARDLTDANEHLAHAVRVAEKHGLRTARLMAMVRIGSHRWMAEADPSGLIRAREVALRDGAVITAGLVDANLALDAALRGDFDRADGLVDTAWHELSRFRFGSANCYILAARAVAAAHRARRREMLAALAELRRWGGDHPRERSLVHGMANAFCALLEEDIDGARRELAAVREEETVNPTTFFLGGHHGLALLLDAVSGVDCPEATDAEVTPRGLRWNRQFVSLARAVTLGGHGDTAGAEQAFADAAAAGEPFATAWHLGLRLVAPVASTQGWGEPVRWLRQAEDYFYGVESTTVANACRALQRRMGSATRQRRQGSDGLPTELRELGVTVREFEILNLLGDRLSNREIATRLHISPRTVEKHVASLLARTGCTDRAGLCAFRADFEQ